MEADNPSFEDAQLDIGLKTDSCVDPESVWICYNINSTLHGSICSDECFEPGDEDGSDRFCWELKRDDCSEPLIYEWQMTNCRTLNICSSENTL